MLDATFLEDHRQTNQAQKKALTMVRDLSGSICVIIYSGCSQKAELGPEMDNSGNFEFHCI